MTPTPSHRVARWALALSLGIAMAPSAADAATSAASETITGGSLAFINSTPSPVAFPTTTLNGTDQTQSQTQTIDVSDARGTGVGWNITATSTNFVSGGNSLVAGSVQVLAAPAVACDSGVSCVTAVPSTTYPYTLPSGTTAPAATKFYNATASTGTGAQTVTPTWRLAVPATAATGTYTSTWTLSLVSGP